MNWPEEYHLIGDSLIANIALPGEISGVINLNKDPRKQEILPDCYEGTVLEVGAGCKLVKVGDKIVFTRWKYSQSDVDDNRICLREVDLVIVNEKCVNGYVAVHLYKPFKKVEQLTLPGRPQRLNYAWGKIIDIDYSIKIKDTEHLREGDIILFQRMDDFQYFIGQHTMVFKNIPDVILVVLEELANVG